MRFWLTLLLAAPCAAQTAPVALHASLGAALEHVGLAPYAPALDPRLSAFMVRLSALNVAPALSVAAPVAIAPIPAAAVAPPAAAPSRSLATQRTIAAVSAALEGLSPDEIQKMPGDRAAETAARMWENARPSPGAAVDADSYAKRYAYLDAYMRARGYETALRARDFARGYHTGRRKDGVTPEFQHQVEIGLFLTTLKDLKDEQAALAAAFLHDVMEDYDVPRAELENRFGSALTETVWRLTKTYRGVKKDPDAYFRDIAADPIASVVKGADRIHNVQSMVGVFGTEHQKEYLDEVDRWFLPMLKEAARRFPAQSSAYFNITHMLKSQRQLIRAMLSGR